MQQFGRIVLGTVQFGVPYGRTANRGVLSQQLVFEILDRAWELGIRSFDTATGYGDSARRLSNWIRLRSRAADCHIVTKIRAHAGVPDLSEIPDAVEPFADCASVTVLSHGVPTSACWPEMVTAVAQRGAAVGVSLYDNTDIQHIAKLPNLSLIQTPGSILDRRGIHARSTSPIRLDIRSVFLQGLWLDEPDVAEQRVHGSRPYVEALRAHAESRRLPLATALIGGMFGLTRNDDRLVLGFDAPDQLVAIAHLADTPVTVLSDFLMDVSKDPILTDLPARILDPRAW